MRITSAPKQKLSKTLIERREIGVSASRGRIVRPTVLQVAVQRTWLEIAVNPRCAASPSEEDGGSAIGLDKHSPRLVDIDGKQRLPGAPTDYPNGCAP